MIRKAKVEGGVVVGIPAADPRITAFKGIPIRGSPRRREPLESAPARHPLGGREKVLDLRSHFDAAYPRTGS